MMPVTWPEFGKIHPLPQSQTRGYQVMFEQLESALAEITGFAEFLSSPMLAHRANTRDCLLFVSTTNTGVKVTFCLIPSQLMGQILLVQLCAA